MVLNGTSNIYSALSCNMFKTNISSEVLFRYGKQIDYSDSESNWFLVDCETVVAYYRKGRT